MNTIIIFADELVSILDQDLDATEELDQLRQAVYAYRDRRPAQVGLRCAGSYTIKRHAPTNTITKQERTRIQNSADWLHLTGTTDIDELAARLVELWGISPGRAINHAAHAIHKARNPHRQAPETVTMSTPFGRKDWVKLIHTPEAARLQELRKLYSLNWSTQTNQPTYTPAQEDVLRRCPHLKVASALDDGDLLVLDLQPTKSDVFPGHHFGPYVLTTNGFIQNINYHYKNYHGMSDVPFEY